MVVFCPINFCGYNKSGYCNKTVLELSSQGQCSYLADNLESSQNGKIEVGSNDKYLHFRTFKERMSRKKDNPLEEIHIFEVSSKEV